MALQRDTRYPGRWTTGNSAHPQGAFKNRSAPGALDGSYIEQDWANDWDGYFASLMGAAGLTANNIVDAVGASQYYNALTTVIKAQATGRLLRRSIYRNNAGTLQVSIDGAAFVTASSTFVAQTLTARVRAILNGGGGGGGTAASTATGAVSGGGGGSGGGYVEKTLLSGFNGLTIAAGLGGAAGAAGGTSSFGPSLSAPGGNAGSTGATATASQNFVGGTAGPTGTGGDVNVSGGIGWGAFYGTNVISGKGGSSMFGDGAYYVSGAATTGTVGVAAVSPGTGGSGAANGSAVASNIAGGAGAGGIVILEEYA